ncbi:MAG: SDR family oxidoreductase [Ignavibacteriota bacterium]
MKRTALITGASSGFGVEFAKNFAKDGHDLVLVARRVDRLNTLAGELKNKYGITVKVLGKDLNKTEDVQSVCDILQSEKVHIDFLVNNAGLGDFGNFHESEWSKDEQMLDVNIKALTKLTYLFVKPMVEKGFGRILNVASTAAFQPGPLLAVYFATKAYVLSFSEAISNELKGTGVTVTILCPGASESEFLAVARLEDSMLFKRKRVPTSKEVADFGYKEMMNGSLTVIHGFTNKMGALASRFVPRKAALKIVRKIQEKSK